MFYGCSSLSTLDGLESWDVSAVKTLGNRSSYSGNGGAFEYCSNLYDINALASWNLSAVTDIDALFRYCSALTDATGLNGWNLPSLMYEDYVFDNTGIDSDHLPSWY